MHMTTGPGVEAFQARFDQVQLADGSRMRFFHQGPRGNRAILMLHGITDSSFSFSRVLPLVPPHWQVLVPDQRGHGDSDRPGDGYTMDGMARDAIRLLDSMEVQTAVVVGHSMGTYIARHVAAIAGDRVERLMLLSGGPRGDNATTMELVREVNGLHDPVDPAFVRAFQESTIHKPVPAEFMDLVIRESLKVPAAVWKAAFSGLLAYAPVERAIRCPTLVFGGDRDQVFSVDELQKVANEIPGARLRIFPEIGHTLHWEDPKAFVAVLLEEVGN